MKRELKDKIRKIRGRLSDAEIRRVLGKMRLRSNGDFVIAINRLDDLEPPDLTVVHEIHNLCHRFDFPTPNPFTYNTRDKAVKVLSRVAKNKWTLL